MTEQIAFFEIPQNRKNSEKRKWENAFQKWSDENSQHGETSLGCCGFGAICDYCEDNSYGRPCVRALNTMCREKGISIDYSKPYFAEMWKWGGGEE